MNMHLLVLTLVCTVVYGVSRLSMPDLKGVNFAKTITGRKLNGSLIREVEVDSERACQLECVDEERCLSYNFGTAKSNREMFRCQLSDSDRFFGVANFTEEKDFTYGGIQSSCEENSFQCGHKGVCLPNYQDGSVQCQCNHNYAGKPCNPKSCSQLLRDGFNASGVYTINPDGGKPIQVLCDMLTNGGGWTVFQRRVDGSVDFYLEWKSYKNGFGNLKGEFWLGNDNLHRLTAVGNATLRVDLEDFEGNIKYAEYNKFTVADEADKYRLLIGGYSGTAGDSLRWHNNMQFSTKDHDNDLYTCTNCSCSKLYKGSWWYNSCHGSNLNGLYLGGPHKSYADGVEWSSFRGHHYSMKRAEMKLKIKE